MTVSSKDIKRSSAPSEEALPSVLDLSKEQLSAVLKDMGEPGFRATQVWRAVHREGKGSFEEITTLSRPLRSRLAERFSISPLTPAVSLRSVDGSTDKTLFRLGDGEMIETVLMRYEPDGHRRGRKTVCVSTQAGCALGCTFCATGQQGFRRQLSPGEIVAQVLHMEKIARAEDMAEVDAGARSKGEVQGVTNLVFMGMGEPLANYENTLQAIRALNDGQGLGIGARHITLSTVGLVPQILRLADEDLQINLAVSLHAPDNETRSETMPVNRRYPLEVLIDACRKYVERTNRRIFFEYVLLAGQNDTPAHAVKLGRLLDGLLCHVNLIPVNPTGEGPYDRTAPAAAQSFKRDLQAMGIPATLRMEKGIDINAGCGQLRDRVLANAPAEG